MRSPHLLPAGVLCVLAGLVGLAVLLPPAGWPLAGVAVTLAILAHVTPRRPR
jgi:hypothetical protein